MNGENSIYIYYQIWTVVFKRNRHPSFMAQMLKRRKDLGRWGNAVDFIGSDIFCGGLASLLSCTCWGVIFWCALSASWPSYWNQCQRLRACGRSAVSPWGTTCGWWFPDRSTGPACWWGTLEFAIWGLWWYEHPFAVHRSTRLINLH